MLAYKNIGVMSSRTHFDNSFDYTLGAYVKTPYANSIHFHEFYELEFILSGDCMQVFNGVQTNMKQGSLYLLTPADFHGYISDDNESWRFFSIQFKSDFLPQHIFKEIHSFSGPFIAHFEDEDYEVIAGICNNMLNENHDSKYMSDEIIKNNLSTLCILLLRTLYRFQPAAEDNDHSKMSVAISYIRQNFRKKLALSQVANVIHLSPSYFSDQFSKSMQMSFSSYVRHLRLDLAMKLVKTTDLTFDQICYESGFNDFAYFSKAFKEYHGKSPKHFRKSET